MAVPLVKFMGRRTSPSGRGPLHWGRADIDGAPFCGPPLPPMPEEEIESRSVRVADPCNRIFDLQDPAENTAYLDILDGIANGWFQLLHRQFLETRIKRKDPNTGDIIISTQLRVYMEWIEKRMIDGKPNLSQRPYLGQPNDD